MKNMALLNLAGIAPLPVYMGEIAAGGSVVQDGLLQNTGDEVLSSVRFKVAQSDTQPGVLTVQANGVLIGETWTEVLLNGATLAPSTGLAVTLTFNNPSGNLVDAEDTGLLSWDYL